MLNNNTSSMCPHDMANFDPVMAEIGSGVWGTQQISTAFAFWQRYCTACSSGRRSKFAAMNRGRHLYSAGRPSRWALVHVLVISLYQIFETTVVFPVDAGNKDWQFHNHTTRHGASTSMYSLTFRVRAVVTAT